MFPASTAKADQEYPWEQVEASGDFVPPPTMDSQIDQEEDVVKLEDDNVNHYCLIIFYLVSSPCLSVHGHDCLVQYNPGGCQVCIYNFYFVMMSCVGTTSAMDQNILNCISNNVKPDYQGCVC